MNITFTKAELFAIRYSINHMPQLQDITHTVVITDAIPATKWIFDIFIYSHQLHSIAISNNFKAFFDKNSNSLILF